MPDIDFPDGPEQTELTRAAVLRYHVAWKHRDLEAVMALYHPDIEYRDFSADRVMRLADLRDEIVGFEFAALVPADLAADIDLRAPRGDTIGITLGGQPPEWLEEFHGCLSC